MNEPELVSMTEDRPHARYAGPERYTWLNSGERVHKGQRWFTGPARVRPDTVTWRREDQAWAIGEGFFVERVLPLNRVRLVSLNPLLRETEAALSGRLLQSLFRNPSSTRLQRLFRFVEQQDVFGWSNTWEVAAIEMMRGPRQMRWLADWHHDKRMGARGPETVASARVYDHVRADKVREGREELGLETRELRRIYTPGCPCTYCQATSRSMLATAA